VDTNPNFYELPEKEEAANRLFGLMKVLVVCFTSVGLERRVLVASRVAEVNLFILFGIYEV
jgi:hypothetical protein